jgi:hypothetical protein
MPGGLYWLRDIVRRRNKEKGGVCGKKIKKQGCHRQFLFLLLFSPAAAPKISLKNPFAPHLRTRHNTSTVRGLTALLECVAPTHVA